MRRFARYMYPGCRPLGKDGRVVTGSEEHIALSRKAAGEGMVLLKNENNTLPLKKGTNVVLFGKGSVDYIKGGGGSGEVNSKYIRNVYDGFGLKEAEGKVKVFRELENFYKAYIEEEQKRIKATWKTEYPKLFKIEDIMEHAVRSREFYRDVQVRETKVPDDIFDAAADFADTAIITISRYSGEGWERSSEKGDFYLTDEEYNLVKKVKAAFKTTVIVLDVGGMVDSEWFINDDSIGAVLLAWQAGMEGGLAIADILCGDVNPSGKLTDTFAKSFDDYPSSAEFHKSLDYVDYTEDIYVGYRYFETLPNAKKRVNYPFGFGLSYTEFELSEITVSEAKGEITVSVNVKNIGKCAGKEVVQVYYSAPQGLLGKPTRELGGFAKTKLLEPNEMQIVTLNFKVSDMSSFDDLGKIQKSAFILEKGEYEFYIGTSVRETVKAEYKYILEGNTVCEQLSSYCTPVALEKRLLANGNYEKLPLGEAKHIFKENKSIIAKAPETEKKFDSVPDEISLDEFIAQFSDEELCEFMGGDSNIGVSNTCCFSGMQRLDVPRMSTADGPAGLRLHEFCGIPTTAWPCATLLACTFNTDLVEEIGKAGGLEVKENNIAFWLTPALNIHRNPLCGRNFEYFSEDPLVSGKMAAAKVRGMQSVGTGCSAKHFACNNKETNRFRSDSRVSERALREIYLKGFEICVKESAPRSIMTSYNLINGIHTSESYELLTEILRNEWGFDGMITTDWGVKNNPVYEVKAGNDMKMHIAYPEDLKEALKTGELQRADLETCAKRILSVYLEFE